MLFRSKKENRSKVKVRKWIDTPDLKRYEQFIMDWHYFLEETAEKIRMITDEEQQKKVLMYVLNLFYIQPYDSSMDFYEQFGQRLNMVKNA